MNSLFTRFNNVEGMNAKSNVLVILLWVFFLTLLSAIICNMWGNNEILLYFLIGFLCVEVLSIIFAYGFFAFKNPDYLRSETYTLSKLAIEKGQIGDDHLGLMTVEQTKIIDTECLVKDGKDD